MNAGMNDAMDATIATAVSELSREHASHLFHQMLRIRRFEEACAELYSAMKIRGFLHLYIGEEAIATGVMEALVADDSVVSTYREHGHALARGVSARAVMAEMYGKVDGCSRGRGGSMHIFDKATNFVGGNAIVGGGLPLTIGLALANKMMGRHALSACFFGEGAMAEGEFHESMNLASLWKLPVLFVVENNQYAMGTALARSESQTDLCAHAEVYGVTARRIDGMDVIAVEHAAREAAEAVRSGRGPRFLEMVTYRFRAHSMFDAELYRDKEEVQRWKKRDPVDLFARHAEELGLFDSGDVANLEAQVKAEIDDAIAFSEASPDESPSDLHRYVTSERSNTVEVPA